MKKSEINVCNKLPQLPVSDVLLIFDRKLLKSHRSWILRFPRRFGVKSGESLKSLQAFPDHMSQILKLTHDIPRTKLKVIAFGGGSVGDFSGFIASVLKRGVGLVQIPSTWLAAMDSAHGGKTALNVANYKNQIGTFYPAETVYLVKEVLLKSPQELVLQAAGEYYKTLLLVGGSTWKNTAPMSELNPKKMWLDLPQIVEGKWKIVLRDPQEINGTRYLLNLGHTVGHVLELGLGLPHGRAVHLGLRFAWQWSVYRGLWKGSDLEPFLPTQSELARALIDLAKRADPMDGFLHDKKLDRQNSKGNKKNQKIRFIFLRKPGYPVQESIDVAELKVEWNRQSRLINSTSKVKSQPQKA